MSLRKKNRFPLNYDMMISYHITFYFILTEKSPLDLFRYILSSYIFSCRSKKRKYKWNKLVKISLKLLGIQSLTFLKHYKTSISVFFPQNNSFCAIKDIGNAAFIVRIVHPLFAVSVMFFPATVPKHNSASPTFEVSRLSWVLDCSWQEIMQFQSFF